MLKKVLIALGLVLLLTALLVGTMLPATAATNAYQVGYARVDVNPYVVDGDFSSGIMSLPLRGSGDVWNRLSTTMVDDNGDGQINAEDGLKATCVAVTDETGKTVLLINIDLIGGTLINKVNAAIVERVEAAIACGEIDNVDLAKEAIYYGGTHTHNAPDTSVYTASGRTDKNSDGVSLKEVNENLGIWIDRTIEDVADAAILALKDRAAATITKDQLSASKATSQVVKGKTLTMTRHYVNGEDGSVAGDNFNDRGSNPTQVTDADDTMYLLKFSFKDSSKLPIIFTGWRGHPSLNNSDSYGNGGRTCLSSDYVNAYRHALEFGVDVTIDQDYGVGHVTSWELGDTQKYRVIFFNGTGGNTNPRGYELKRDASGNVLTYGSGTTVKGYSWIDVSASKAEIKGRGCSFGVVLATLAQECLTDGKNATAVPYGEIKTMQKKYTAPRKTVGISSLSHNAGVAYQASDALYDTALAAYNTANSKFSAYKTAKANYDNAGYLQFMYKSKMDTALKEYNTANATLTTKLNAYVAYMEENFTNTPTQVSTTVVGTTLGPTKPLQTHPMIYKQADGQTFAIGSRFHASNLVTSWNTKLDIPKTGDTSVTLNAFMFGQELAFVVVPGEPFDYYFKEHGVYTPENNLWNILDDDTYGKPIVLGYTNGALGYFPNYEAYFYNEGRTDKAIGSYETQNNTKEAGSGEKMIYEFHSMLSALNGKLRTAYCEHCKQDAVWVPFAGQTLETGHYYLCSDYESPQMLINDGITVCFDLNGYTYTGASRAFYYNSNANAGGKATLSIMDSSAKGTGVLRGCGGDVGAGRGFGGGTIFMGIGHELNIYGGTITGYEKGNNSSMSGAVLLIRGTLNMYGGEITGGTVSSFTGSFYSSGTVTEAERTGLGGNINITGTFNMYGGKVTGGKTQKIVGTVIGDADLGYANVLTVEPYEGLAPCVCVTTYSGNKGKVNLYGDASIDHVYFSGLGASQFTVNGDYTGSVELQFSGTTAYNLGDKVGIAQNADASRSTITVREAEGMVAAVKDSSLILSEKSWSYGYCEGCKDQVQWQPMGEAEFNQYNGVSAGATRLPAGHYRMTENVLTDQKQLNGKGDHPGTFCLDLNGHTFTGKTRAFYTYDDSVLNIQDSVGGGVVEGKSGNGMGGGVVYVQGNTTVNLYGGTIRHNNETADYVLNGGCVRVNGGTFRMYDGTLEGVNVSDCGGAIYTTVRNSVPAKVEILGGTVLGATAAKAGDCIYLSGKCTILLGGNASVEDIYFAGDPAAALTVDTTSAAFTGFAQITCADAPAAGAALGTCLGTNGITAGSVVLADSNMPVFVSGDKLVTEIKAFRLLNREGIYASFDTFAEALAAYTYDAEQGTYICLTEDVNKADINKTVCVDLNGFYFSQPTIQDGVVLYAMDSQTDDFTIEDELAYGMVYNPVLKGTGSVQGVPAESGVAEDGYLMLAEGKGYSFHRVSLRIKSMSLRVGMVGVYYSCDFKGDEIVAENVKSFGIALSAVAVPDAENLNTKCAYTALKDFAPGAGGNAGTGVLLSGIMKPANTVEQNIANAQTDVCGRAYLETVDGDYVFGSAVTRNLRQLVEAIDAVFADLNDLQRGYIMEFCDTYSEETQSWDISNIRQG